MDEDGPSGYSQSEDDFQRAMKAAQAEAGQLIWPQIWPSDQCQAIYTHLRRIDAEGSASVVIVPMPRGRLRASTNASGRWRREGPASAGSQPVSPSSE